MYPQRLYRTPGPDSVIVNDDAERESAVNSGYAPEVPSKQEYPKALYLHPSDETKEHKAITVRDPAEQEEAESSGYQVTPHIPVSPDDFVADPMAESSGIDGDAGDWTTTNGEGLTDDTSA